MENVCMHERAQLIARREGVDYVRCQDCGQVFEADDLESASGGDDEEQQGVGRAVGE
jgi:nitrite reductase/ring-hydroxylating ferredoxin subunit